MLHLDANATEQSLGLPGLIEALTRLAFALK